MNAPTPETAAPAPPQRLPTLRLDASRYHSRVIGERTAEDPQFGVAFWQDGFPFAADGELVADDGKRAPWDGRDVDGKPVRFHPLWTDKMRTALQKRLERLARNLAPQEENVDEHSSPGARDQAAMEVDLVGWLRGELRYEPWLIQRAAKLRYNKVYARLKDLVVDLVMDERLVAEDQLAPSLRGYLGEYGAADSSLKH